MPSDQVNESASTRKSWFAKHQKWLIPLVVPVVSGVALLAATGYFKSDETTADRVAACRKAHDLQQDRQQKQDGNQTLFVSCTWPPTSGVTATDGYAQIAVQSGQGPGKSEMTGASYVDTVRPSCSRVELTYTYAKMGQQDIGSAIKADTGSIFQVSGTKYPENPTSKNWEPGDNGPKTSIFAKPNEIIIVRNMSYTLFDAKCI
ncbi:hypothetical protein AB0N24_25425 [Arthrobacter sp. NPDC093128]|uniref:hypothetical protein n=1 Tax=Arthrobacter sp. NPDC093128 TaxID=3154979 RepID=UPI00342296B3